MAESLLDKANRLGIAPVGTPAETLTEKAQRLGIKPAGTTDAPSYQFPEILKTVTSLPRNIMESFDAGIEKSGKGLKQILDNPATKRESRFSELGRGVLNLGSGLLETAASPITGTMQTAAKLPGVSDALGLIEKGVIKGTDPISDIQAVQEFAMNNPNAEEVFSNALNIITSMYGGKTAKGGKGSIVREATDNATIKPAIDEVSNIASDVGTMIDRAIPDAPPAVADTAKIVDEYTRAVRPTIAGKQSAPQVANYNRKVVEGVNAITENRQKLQFTDEDGNIVRGRTPETLEEFSQAIDQTKRGIYREYNALAKASGEKGGQIDIANTKTKVKDADGLEVESSIADELDTIINDKSLPISNPEVIAKAKALKERLLYEVDTLPDGKIVRTLREPVDTEFTQNLLQQLNDKLKAYYRNPTPNMASEAALDAMVANRLRTMLDQTIESTEGAGYQALKNKYGALKAMEADVAKRAQVYGRQNNKGLIDYSDIFTGGQVLNGILSGNVAQVATGLGARAIKEFIKWKNSPDRAIKSLFEEARKSPRRSLPQPTYSNPGDQTNPQLNSKSSSSPKPSTSGKEVKGLETLSKEVKKYKSAEDFSSRFAKMANDFEEVIAGKQELINPEGFEVYKKVKAEIQAYAKAGGKDMNLKDFYNLVMEPKSKLGRMIKEAKASGTQGGFIRIGKDTDPLITEAKKYKNAEEFVSKQPAIYHGTPFKFDKFDPERTPGGSAWFSDNLDAVRANKVEGSRASGQPWNVMERYIKPGVKLVDRNTTAGKKMADNLYREQLESQGYRGIKHEADAERGSYIELFDPNKDTVTKSQLTDIWEKANGKTDSVKAIKETQRDTVASGLSKLTSDDFVNSKGKLNASVFGEVEELLAKIEKGQDSADDIRRGQEILALLKKA